METKNCILKCVSGEEALMVKNNSKEIIAAATKVFAVIDSEFNSYDLRVCEQENHERRVAVYEMVKGNDLNFEKIFTSFNVSLQKIIMTQSQIIDFCRRHPKHLHKHGLATLFLLEKYSGLRAEYSVVRVFIGCNGALSIVSASLWDKTIWRGGVRRRVVIPYPWLF